MSQSYIPGRTMTNESSSSNSAFVGFSGEKQLKVEDVQEAYMDQKGR